MPFGQPFDRGHGTSIAHDRQRQAGVDAHPVHQDSTSAALPMITPFFYACDFKPVAQKIEQCDERLNVKSVTVSID